MGKVAPLNEETHEVQPHLNVLYVRRITTKTKSNPLGGQGVDDARVAAWVASLGPGDNGILPAGGTYRLNGSLILDNRRDIRVELRTGG